MKNIFKRFLATAFAIILAATIVSFPSAVGNTVAADGTKVRATLTLGNARWATQNENTFEKVNGEKIGKYLLSWDLSVLDVTVAATDGKYSGYVWNTEETEKYRAVLVISQNEVVVDTTSCKAALYVDTTDTTFVIKKSDVFTLYTKPAGDRPAEIVALKNYRVSCTVNSALITVTDMDASGSGDGAEDTQAPEIAYDGELTLDRRVGDCVPVVFAKATDSVDGDVLVKTVWSDGAHDENYKLLEGTHALTLIAKDKAGNVSTVVVTVRVSKK